MLNQVRNGEIEFWGAGPVPSFMAAQVTNTTLSILDLSDERLAASKFAFGARISRNDRYVGEGRRSLRATLVAAAAADAFRLHPLNVGALTFLGATAPAVVLTPGKPYTFSLMVRCSLEGNLLTVRVIARDIAGTVRLSLDSRDGDWIAGAGGDVDLGMDHHWRTLAVQFDAPAADNAGNLIDSYVWQFSNGTGGAQLIDIDNVRMFRSDDQSAT